MFGIAKRVKPNNSKSNKQVQISLPHNLVEEHTRFFREDQLTYTITLSQNKKESCSLLSCATTFLGRCVVDPRFHSTEFISSVVLTYRNYLSPAQFLAQIIAVFAADPTVAVLTRVLRVLETWVDLDVGLADDAETSDAILQFIDARNKSPLSGVHDLETCLDALARAVVRLAALAEPESPLASFVPDRDPFQTLSLDMFDVEKVAAEMTMISHDLFTRIPPNEWLKGAFNKRPESTPHIERWSRMSDRVKQWIVTTILAEKDVNRRARVYEHMIDVATVCLRLHNFHDAMVIWMTLEGTPALTRLSKTIKHVDKEKRHTMSVMEQVLDPSARDPVRDRDVVGLFGAYQSYLGRCRPPCVPALFVVAEKLFKLDEKQPDKTMAGHADMLKVSEMAAALLALIRYQRESYTLNSDPSLRCILLHCPVMTDERDWHALSLSLEKRKP